MKTMRFEGRDLTTYAEPILASALREGQIYFFVYYADEDMWIPLMETVVYVGRYFNPEGKELLRFQDLDSYHRGIRFGSPESEEAQFQSAAESGINHLFEYEKCLEELMRCALRRKRLSDSE